MSARQTDTVRASHSLGGVLVLRMNGTHNISLLLDFGSQLAGLHMHSTYTHSLAQSYENKKNSYAD